METLLMQPETINQQDGILHQAVVKNRSRLVDFIRRRIPDTFDAEDIAQDVFYELVETYRLMKPVEQLASWLFSVARHKITDLYRKQKTSPLETSHAVAGDEEDDDVLMLADLLASADDTAENLIMREAVMETVDEALDELPEEQRDAFVMHEMDGMKFEEISTLTGVPVKTLISRKRYAVMHLKKRLQHLYDDLLNN